MTNGTAIRKSWSKQILSGKEMFTHTNVNLVTFMQPSSPTDITGLRQVGVFRSSSHVRLMEEINLICPVLDYPSNERKPWSGNTTQFKNSPWMRYFYILYNRTFWIYSVSCVYHQPFYCCKPLLLQVIPWQGLIHRFIYWIVAVLMCTKCPVSCL